MMQRFMPSMTFVTTSQGLDIVVNPVNLLIDNLVVQAAAVLVGSYNAVCTTLMYFDLRARKEGFDLELAAQKESAEGAANS